MGEFHVGVDHHFSQLFESNLWGPVEGFFGLGGVAKEEVDLGGAEIAGVYFDKFLPVEIEAREDFVEEFADGVGFTGGDDEIVGGGELEHLPHGLDIIAGVSPVAFGVQISQVEFFLEAFFDAGCGAGDFSCDEGFTAAGAFVVEEDSVAGKHAVAFAVVDGLPEAIDFRAGVGAARIEGGCFGLGRFDDFAVHFGAGSLVEADGQSGVADGFEEIHGSEGVDSHGINGLVEADADVGLGAEVVDFIRFYSREDFAEAGAIDKIAVMEEETGVGVVAITVEVFDAVGVEGGGSADDAVDVVPFGEQEFGEVGPVLAGDSGDESCLAGGGLHEYAPKRGVEVNGI
jgi:hypothetical protein